MTSFVPRSFCRVDVLQQISPSMLIQVLLPYREYLESRGFQLPNSASERCDCHLLSAVLLATDAEAPLELLEALHVIGNTGTARHIDDLLEIAATEGVDVDAKEQVTPVDLAARVWFRARRALEKLERRGLSPKQLTFQHFSAQMSACSMPIDDLPIDLGPLTSALAHWFENHQRGNSVRVQWVRSSTEARFLITHGRPRKRLNGGNGSSALIRADQTDVVIYDNFRNELRVRAKTSGEVRMYVSEFSRHVFGEGKLFVCTQKYTLKPLQERGREALNCRGIDGLDSIRLREIEWVWPAPSNTVQVYRSADVFDHLRINRLRIPKAPIVCKASFDVNLTGVPIPRLISIRLPNTATYGRGEEVLLIEQWLRQQGFIVPAVEVNRESVNETMEGV
jgi:hypothetical protein